jgi:hypothetical protein
MDFSEAGTVLLDSAQYTNARFVFIDQGAVGSMPANSHRAPQRSNPTSTAATGFVSEAHPDVLAYLNQLMRRFTDFGDQQVSRRVDASTLPEQIFSILTSREFSYLSKTKAEPYKSSIVQYVDRAARSGKPLAFYYDIGGGYHASIRPGNSNLVFDVGLAEVFALAQIASFHRSVLSLYAPGTKFSFVIDNLCALLINDVPTSSTTAYCSQLRCLIRDLGMEELVNVLVESENFDPAEYRATANGSHMQRDAVSDKELENVERFLGRRCDRAEALERINRYQHVTGVSERLFNGIIDGVHMTQRASPTTIAFRPFPGGDSRIQTGQVAITRNAKDKLHPVLLTSENIDSFRCENYQFPEILPSVVGGISYAERRIE